MLVQNCPTKSRFLLSVPSPTPTPSFSAKKEPGNNRAKPVQGMSGSFLSLRWHLSQVSRVVSKAGEDQEDTDSTTPESGSPVGPQGSAEGDSRRYQHSLHASEQTFNTLNATKLAPP